jgi:hypothetical protein
MDWGWPDPKSGERKMTFTTDNTDGFTSEELDLMNEAIEILVERGMDESNASDQINNAYVPGATLADLIK